MSPKSWKDHLLSSGLPLEQSVIQTLRELGIRWPREYKYERLNENGIPTVFSVDIHAQVMEATWLEFFIECKYRHDGTRWVFIPAEYESLLDEGFHETFIILDQLDEDTYFDSWCIHKKCSGQYDLCAKGVELLSNDANPKSIEQSIQQLRYALVEESVTCLRSQIVEWGVPTPIFVLIPIVVTTAELWRIRPEITIEAIRQAEELIEIAERRDAIVVKQPPDNQLTRHTKTSFEEHMSAEERALLDDALKKRGSSGGYSYFVSAFSNNRPSLFLVINYLHFANKMRDLLSLFSDSEIRKKKLQTIS